MFRPNYNWNNHYQYNNKRIQQNQFHFTDEERANKIRELYALNNPDIEQGDYSLLGKQKTEIINGVPSLSFFNVKKTVKVDRKHLFIGKSGSGKTTKALEVLYQLKDQLDEVYVFTGSIDGFYFWKKYIPKEYIYPGWNAKKFQNIMNSQCEEVFKLDQDPKYRPKHVLIILEDLGILSDLLNRDTYVRMFFYNGRSLFMSGFVLTQHIKDMGPKIRCNTHYIYINYLAEQTSRKAIFELWGGICESFPVFERIMNKYTQNRGCLVIDNESQSRTLNEMFYWFTVSDDEYKKLESGFSVGSPVYLATVEYMRYIKNEYYKQLGLDKSEMAKVEYENFKKRIINMSAAVKGGKDKKKKKGMISEEDEDGVI